eukprot:TRINITY_DN4232_c0_g1_i1.p2 TRINITY_DN4232_c0_g1~~TRINITY_DN4232_c0_g1_i1.p2  ORF type:complete len:109 (-),score=31.31 TRINITY_DN4232_c0_g1_i1:89-415(-)
MDAAIIPELKDETDAAMFDDFEPMESCPDTALYDQGDGNFDGYTYKLHDDDNRVMTGNTFDDPGLGKQDEGDDNDNDNDDDDDDEKKLEHKIVSNLRSFKSIESHVTI